MKESAFSTSKGNPSFFWGVATSAHQIEGGNIHNDWWTWEKNGNIEGGATSGKATDHWNRVEEDIRLAAYLNINSYRFSLEWSRVEPQEGQWDESAFDWYEKLLRLCEEQGIVPMLTLHHFTSPQWFSEMGGFSHPEAVSYFIRYVKKVVERLGTHVPLWCTLNEPMVMISGGYLGKFMPPGVFRPDLLPIVCNNLLRCHIQSYEWIRQQLDGKLEGKFANHPLQVGFSHNMIDFRPHHILHPLEQLFSYYFDRFYNRSWLDAVTGKKQNFGVPFFVPKGPPVTEALGKVSSDFVGVNYYTKAYVKWRPKDNVEGVSDDVPFGLFFARRREDRSDVGWAIHPTGFKRILQRVSHYGLPLYITENGIADRADRYRSDYIIKHLRVIGELMDEQTDIRGYYHWSLVDNFEWVKGFGPRFGLFHVDYETYKRTPRQSARVFRKIVKSHEGKRPNTRFLEEF